MSQRDRSWPNNVALKEQLAPIVPLRFEVRTWGLPAVIRSPQLSYSNHLLSSRAKSFSRHILALAAKDLPFQLITSEQNCRRVEWTWQSSTIRAYCLLFFSGTVCSVSFTSSSCDGTYMPLCDLEKEWGKKEKGRKTAAYWFASDEKTNLKAPMDCHSLLKLLNTN